MVSTTFFRFSGAALCLSGFLYIADTALDVLAPAASPGLGALVPVLGLVGFPGLWLWLSGGGGEAGLIGWPICSVCLALQGW